MDGLWRLEEKKDKMGYSWRREKKEQKKKNGEWAVEDMRKGEGRGFFVKEKEKWRMGCAEEEKSSRRFDDWWGNKD